MDKKSKILVWAFVGACFLIFLLLVGRFYFARHFIITSEVECDPVAEECFVRYCEEDCEVEGEPMYYKIRTVSADEIPVCDPHHEECTEVVCSEVATCFETFCDEENVPEGEECNDPEVYMSQLPEEEPETMEEEDNTGSDGVIEFNVVLPEVPDKESTDPKDQKTDASQQESSAVPQESVETAE